VVAPPLIIEAEVLAQGIADLREALVIATTSA